MRLLLSTISLLLSLTVVSAEPRQETMKLMGITITEPLFEAAFQAQRPQTISYLNDQFAEKGLSVSDMEIFVEVLQDEMLSAYAQKMRAAMAVKYETDYSEEELAELLAFYQTDVGKKLIFLTPSYVKFGSEAGGKAGAEAGSEAFERVKKRLDARDVTISEDSGVISRLLNAFK